MEEVRFKMESILTSVKKVLGIHEEYTNFDADIIIHINTAFVTLNQLGVGPLYGFVIEDAEAKWDDYIISCNMTMVKSYIYLKVRMLFDPPSSSALLESMKQMINEMEWRLVLIGQETSE